jgi:hypothetical protein
LLVMVEPGEMTLEMKEISSSLPYMAEQFCSLLKEHDGLGTIRVSMTSGSWLGQGDTIVSVARRYGLRCWFTKSDLVLQAPENDLGLRIDRRGTLPVVTFARLMKKDGR